MAAEDKPTDDKPIEKEAEEDQTTTEEEKPDTPQDEVQESGGGSNGDDALIADLQDQIKQLRTDNEAMHGIINEIRKSMSDRVDDGVEVQEDDDADDDVQSENIDDTIDAVDRLFR